jgi:hypothetical protein
MTTANFNGKLHCLYCHRRVRYFTDAYQKHPATLNAISPCISVNSLCRGLLPHPFVVYDITDFDPNPSLGG